MAAKKKAARKKKAGARKKAARKQKAAPSKQAARKKAARKKAARKKKAGARKNTARASEGDAAEADRAEDGAEDAGAQQDAGSLGLRRGRRRVSAAASDEGERAPTRRSRREIPPLPEGDIPPLPDEGEEDTGDEHEESSRARPRRRRPRRRRTRIDRALVQKLVKVREGGLHISDLDDLADDEVSALARHVGLPQVTDEARNETLYRLVNDDIQALDGTASKERRDDGPKDERVEVEGLLELHPDGYGFLRKSHRSYQQHPDDVYVSANLVRRLGLQPGHWITGQATRRKPKQAQLALSAVEEVNHEDPSRVEHLTAFDKLTVVYPDQRLPLETTPDDVEMRVMDLFCPLGRGQRGLIVAPPRTGKTIMLTKLADAIATNSPDVDIVVLLLDERPEEVTNMRRSVRGEVIASTFDKPASNHIRVAELVVEKVKRMVEFGRHVVLLLDSITRMGRAYNNATGGSGRILTGGLDAKALTKPKRFFGSARNVEDGGSLTIVATALVDTGSRMDEVIFEEFKGTGNMELVLSRDMANARVWPAIDVPKSATRNEDLLMHPDELRRVTLVRRGITGQEPTAVMLALRDQMRKNPTNAEFLMQLGN